MFRGTQTEDDRGPLSIQSSMLYSFFLSNSAIFEVRGFNEDKKNLSKMKN